MDIQELNDYYNKFKYGEDNFHDLMRFRVKEILLISSLYDAYIFEHDAALTEQIISEYQQLNLTTVPRITSVPTGDEALRKLMKNKYDLVITTMRIGELSPFELARRTKTINPNLPVLLLLTIKSDIALLDRNIKLINHFDNAFLWNGDPKLFLAMIKSTEDKKNVDYDTKKGLVRVILLVEDSIQFQSAYLPLLYTEIMEQTQRLISEELNDMQKNYRMRTRPKVLVVKSYEKAVEICNKFRENMLCVISDIQYYHNNKIEPQAGIKLITKIKKDKYDIPLLLQSSDRQFQDKAYSLGVHFIHKRSPTLLNDLRDFILKNLGFGDFVFHKLNGEEAGRAHTLAQLERIIPDMPVESVNYHGRYNNFSAWLIAHGEFQVARIIRPIKESDFDTFDEYRQFLIGVFEEVRLQRNRGKIINFDISNIDTKDITVRLADGSLGGKGRGLAFFNALLVTMELHKRFEDVKIQIPTTTIIGTTEFDDFIRRNNLYNVLNCDYDEVIMQRFLEGKLSVDLIYKLREFLKITIKPLAVRSSGLLEDSQSQPFAGVYKTFMLPNIDEDLDKRMDDLTNAIKLVYASAFLQESKSYLNSHNYRIEEEKMAVVIQGVVGDRHGEHFYPHFSGVAQSHNYYPISHMEHSDGVASVAVGLGHTVVEGGKNYRFCPAYPNIQYLSTEDIVKSTQTEFYALDLNSCNKDLTKGEHATLLKLPIEIAEKEGTLHHLASVWDANDQRIEDGLSKSEPRVVNFANVLKYDHFPLAQILEEILQISEMALGVPVEIEFAVNLSKNNKEKIIPTFYLLQARPQTVNTYETNIEIKDIRHEDIILYAENGLGHGTLDNIYDIIYLDPAKFDKTDTIAMQAEIEKFNQFMLGEDRDYILIGPGRWGSRDRFLGIPVRWAQICKAKIIVETGLPDFNVDPSQGAHFFHNLIALDVGYLNIPYNDHNSFIDWEALNTYEIVKKGKYFVHIHAPHAFHIIIDGKNNKSVIFKAKTDTTPNLK